MKLQNPSKPLNKFGISANYSKVSPSDCPDGDLNVTLPNGTTAKLHNAIGCCYSYPSCNPCSGAKSTHYDKIIGEHFPDTCGTNNVNDCYYYVNCNGI